jgi:hypothetical protein
MVRATGDVPPAAPYKSVEPDHRRHQGRTRPTAQIARSIVPTDTATIAVEVASIPSTGYSILILFDSCLYPACDKTVTISTPAHG